MLFRKLFLSVRNLTIIFFLCLLLFSLSCCGKIGDPIPPDKVILKPIYDLAAYEENGLIVLKWSIADKHVNISRIKILRDKRETMTACLSCDLSYITIADLPLKDSRLVSNHGDFVYRDNEVQTAFTYTYSVIFCDGSDYCSDKSNSIDVNFIGKRNEQ